MKGSLHSVVVVSGNNKSLKDIVNELAKIPRVKVHMAKDIIGMFAASHFSFPAAILVDESVTERERALAIAKACFPYARTYYLPKTGEEPKPQYADEMYPHDAYTAGEVAGAIDEHLEGIEQGTLFERT